MLYLPLTRAGSDPDPNYSTLFYLNVDQSLSIVRALDNTHTRIRGNAVFFSPEGVPTTSIEVLVIETPEQIAALIAAAPAVGRHFVRR